MSDSVVSMPKCRFLLSTERQGVNTSMHCNQSHAVGDTGKSDFGLEGHMIVIFVAMIFVNNTTCLGFLFLKQIDKKFTISCHSPVNTTGTLMK